MNTTAPKQLPLTGIFWTIPAVGRTHAGSGPRRNKLMAEKLLYVGLDRDNQWKNLDLARELVSSEPTDDFGFKVNLDHALMWGESYIREVVTWGRDVFVDLKMNNGSRTMSNVVRWLGGLRVTHTNVWAHSEANLAKTLARLEGAEDIPKILAVTFYTRWDEAYAQRHHGMSLAALVGHWAGVAVENGADGIILPANQLAAVSDLETSKLSPAIRIAGETVTGEQQQVETPYGAIKAGADMLVVGSPIHAADNPSEALGTYLAEIRRAEEELAD